MGERQTQNKEERIFYPRGSVLRVDFGDVVGREANGIRFAVVLSMNQYNMHSPNIVVAPFTKAVNRIRNGELKILGTQHLIKKEDYPFLYMDSIVQTESLRCVSKHRVKGYIGYLDSKDMNFINQCLSLLFDLDSNSIPSI